MLTIERVEERGLAKRLLALGGRVADVVSPLPATHELRLSVDLVGLKDGEQPSDGSPPRIECGETHDSSGVSKSFRRKRRRGECRPGPFRSLNSGRSFFLRKGRGDENSRSEEVSERRHGGVVREG